MKVTRKNYCYSEVTVKQMDELMKKLGISASDVFRRAVEMYWEAKVGK
jgi:hypothetical protein